MKSKICITILIVMITFSIMNTINFKSIASTTASLELDTKVVAQGSNVEVNVNLLNDVDFSAGNFEITYDSSVLEFVDYTIGSSLKNSAGSTNGTVSFNGNTKGKIKFAYMSEVNQTSETKTAGKLITLIFKVKSGAGTSTDINFKVTTLKKDDGTDVNTNIKNGKLKIISGVQFNKSNVALETGQKMQLNLSTLPTLIDVSNETVTWKSANTSVAIVEQNGLVTAVGVGTTQITAKLLGYSAVCKISVSGQLGDVDKDKKITAYDAYKALETSVNILIGIEVDEQVILTADVDRDKKVTAQDAYKILQYSVGDINKF